MGNPEKLVSFGTQDTTRGQTNKTRALQQTTGGKDEQNIVVCGNRNGLHNTRN